MTPSCTHLERPENIVSQSEQYLDWGKKSPTAIDRAKHDIKGKRPFEWWYFDGHLDNGQTFVGSFLAPSFLNGKPAVILSIYDKDWNRETLSVVLSQEDMIVSKEDVRIDTPFGFVHRLDDRTTQVRFNMENIVADFKLTTTAPGWMPSDEDGVNAPEREFFWAVHQGKNRIKGYITQDGETTQVTGVGYADHNWGTKPLNEITNKWIWGRITDEKYTIIFADVEYIDPSINSRPLYIAKGDKIIVGTGSPTISQSNFVTDSHLGRHYPRGIEIEFEEGEIKTHIQVRHKHTVEAVDLLPESDYNFFTRWLIRTFVARPSYFRIIAEYEGVISESGVKNKITGECIYEVMVFE
jgi:hypothetical protein